MGESFCQPVCDHFRVWNMLEIDLPSSHFVTIIVLLDIDMLCSSVIDRIVDKGNESLIVTFERDGGVY